MGQTIKAYCKNCDSTKKFDFGGGIMNFTFYSLVSAIKIKTERIKNPNYKKVEDYSKYYFYLDDKLKRDHGF
jgi:hypothetical protein